VRDQGSHPNKTPGKITALCILVFIFSYGKMEEEKFCTERQQAFSDFKKRLSLKYENP
jgi:hypothetical protein